MTKRVDPKAMRQMCMDILRKNDLGKYTVPTHGLYPYQWNWDSGFVSIGFSRFNIERAIVELETLFSGQWKNGMLPHIVFHDLTHDTYFPGPEFWKIKESIFSPSDVKTSGITQPPVHGFALEKIWQRISDKPKYESRIKKLISQVAHNLKYFYQERDPNSEGLVFIFHPWESGRDNSPVWDEAMQRINIIPENLPFYERKDLEISDGNHRPTQDKYDRYVKLMQVGIDSSYDGHKIAASSPLLVQDVMFNAILLKSMESMISLTQELKVDNEWMTERYELGMDNFDSKFWDDQDQWFYNHDLISGEATRIKDIGGLVAGFGVQLSQTQKSSLLKYLERLVETDHYLCPSYDPQGPLYNNQRYWRGPIWPHMNWMIYHALLRNQETKWAEAIRKDTLELIGRFGFHEYFEPSKILASGLDVGYGGKDFSWTSSSVLDLLYEL